MKAIMIFVGFIGFLLIGETVMADFKTEEGAMKWKIYEAEQWYKGSSGKEPTPENLVNSLEIKDARGKKAGEIRFALELIRRRDIGINDDEMIAKILACFENNSHLLVRVESARTLTHVNREKGLELSHKMLRDEETSLRYKLFIAQNLVNDEGVLLGYPVLQEGLLSPSDRIRRSALITLESFRIHDGTICEISGVEVDISGLVAESKEKAQQILDDLEAIEGIDSQEETDKE